MKYLTIAVFLGYVSASDAIHDAINALKIQVTEKGQKRIEKQFDDVVRVSEQIKDAKPVKKLEHSLKQFAHTKEVAHIKEIDEKFMQSRLGKKMVKEWTDVGRVLQENLQASEGHVHFPNEKLDELADEVEDVGNTYDRFFKSRWAKKYDEGWKAAFETEEAHQVAEDFQGFKQSHAGHRLGREIKQLKRAVKRNVNVTDIPEEWKDTEAMYKFTVTPEGEKEIEKELTDVARAAKRVGHSKAGKAVKRSVRRWAHSDEVKEIRKLNHQYLKTEQGKQLLKEWREFGHALKTHIHKTRRGIKIDNDSFQVIHDESEDVNNELKKLAQSKWGKRYEAAWTNATSNKQAQRVGKKVEKMTQTKKWQKLDAELKQLDESIRKNVKVTDIPEELLTNNLRIEINENGVRDIEQEIDDTVRVWEEIKDSEPVVKLEQSVEKLGQTKEAQHIGELNQRFAQSAEGQQLDKEINDFFQALDEHIQETDNGIQIDNEAIKIIEDEADDIDAEFKQLEQSHWAGDYDQAFNDLGKTQEAAEVGQSYQEFAQSDEGYTMGMSLKNLEKEIKRNVRVSDLPEDDFFMF